MHELTINGRTGTFPDGLSILAACRLAEVEIPTLCHDQRIRPAGACRLCVVEVKGWDRPATACTTKIADGMEILTHTPLLEGLRRTLLELMARDYPAGAVGRWPEKQFHRLLTHYGVHAGGAVSNLVGISTKPGEAAPADHQHPFRDHSHPYIDADFARCVTCFRCVRICGELQGQHVWRAWHRGESTRIRPALGATLLESACVSCGACVATCPTGALEDRTVLERGTATSWTRTTCPYCGVGCEMSLGTREGRIVQVRPVLDAPVSKGHLCVKGRYAFDYVQSPDRITEPMIREGGAWRKVSWAEAVAHVSTTLRRIREAHGPDSIGVLGSARGTNEENYLAQKFARVVLGTNNVDCCARVCHAPTAAGMKQCFGTGAATNSFDDIERAAGFLLCGCNPTENHPIVGARIRQAVVHGASLVVVDPRAIELAQLPGAIHLQLRPGTNVPLLHALAQVIVTEGLVDEAALQHRVEGFEAYRQFILPWTPERSAVLCGVSPDLIRKAARAYATGKPSMCFHGLGVTEHTQGTDGVMCLANLALLTGNLGRPGSGVNPLRGQNNVQGSAHMGCEPGNLTGYVPLETARESFESAWGAPLPRAPGLNLMGMMDSAGAGALKALWAIGYDLALTNPDTTITKQSLGRLEFVIVQDLFMNELAREFGHVFLPACGSFEKEGTFMNSERRVQRVRQALPAPGLARPDWEIICAVAGAMGCEKQFRFHSTEAVWDEVRSVWPVGAGLSYARLEAGGLQWPCPDEHHPGTPILHVETFPNGPRAPLRLIDFVPTEESTSPEFPFLLTTGRTLYQFNAGTMTNRTPNELLRGTDTLDMAPADALRLGLVEGDKVRARSRHGDAVLPLRLDPTIQPGGLFATFHSPTSALNQLTSSHRDHLTQTPEYKVVAVGLEKA